MPNITHFDRSALPLPITFYQSELGELSRPDHRRWARPKSGCPFHDSKSKTSFHVQLDSGGFCCFSCGAKGGDVIAFMRQRYSLSFRDACKQLGCWKDGGLSDTEQQRIKAERERRRRELERERISKVDQRRQRLLVRDTLHTVEAVYEKVRTEHNIELMSDLIPHLRQLEDEYLELADLDPAGDRGTL